VDVGAQAELDQLEHELERLLAAEASAQNRLSRLTAGRLRRRRWWATLIVVPFGVLLFYGNVIAPRHAAARLPGLRDLPLTYRCDHAFYRACAELAQHNEDDRALRRACLLGHAPSCDVLYERLDMRGRLLLEEHLSEGRRRVP
jgi:hypothetical protein